MAPGLIMSLSPDEGRKRHWDAAPQDSQASAKSTAVSSSQASPLFHPVDVDARAKHGASAGFWATQDTVDLPPLMGDGFVDELKQALAISGEQSRRFDELLCKWEEAYKMPRFTRAYSDGSLPSPNKADSDRSTTPTKDTFFRGKHYQATVEDCTDAEDNGCTPRSPRTGTPPSRPSSQEPNPDEGHGQRRRAFAASAPTSPTANPSLMREHTAPAAVPPVKEVRFSDRVPVVLQRRSSPRDTRHTGTTNTLPQANTHLPRETSPSPLDAKWGKLFRSRGEPTRRLADVLRGLGLYLTEVYKPTYSLVLTPDKLHKFYCKYRPDKESVDLARIFAPTSREAMRALETLYLDMQCDYHLVQHSSPGAKERPYIPALTREGFVQWMIVIIRAFPDQEASRLSRAITDLPLEAVPEDPEEVFGTRERLPRQISNHLFPAQPNEGALELVTQAIRVWKHSQSSERPPPQLSRSASSSARSNAGQNPAPPLIHSDPKSREEHLSRYRRDRESDMIVEVPRAKRSSPDRRAADVGDDRSSRYTKSYSRQDSPRQSKRFERDDSREPERGSHRKDRRWTMDGSEGTRYRKREERGSRV